MEIRELLKQKGYILILWHKDDVTMMFEKIGKDYTDEDVSHVIKEIEEHQDASMGMNWDVIESYIDDHFNEKEKDGN
jgi:hypothetical protein